MEEITRVEPMRFFVDDTEYVLEFNRDTVKYAEDNGFSRKDAEDKMMIRIPELFYYALRMHQPEIKRSQADDLYFNVLEGLTPGEIERLVDLFNAPYSTLIRTGERKNSRVRML